MDQIKVTISLVPSVEVTLANSKQELEEENEMLNQDRNELQQKYAAVAEKVCVCGGQYFTNCC